MQHYLEFISCGNQQHDTVVLITTEKNIDLAQMLK